jgi:outer membrane protein TolC
MLLFTLAFVTQVYSAELSFPDIWSSIRKNSSSIKAVSEEVEAIEIGSDRASRHWFPKATVLGRAFTTTDPTTTFFYNLGQRQVSALDFVPTSLNEPGNSFFKQGSVQLDLPLVEGGMRWFAAQALDRAAESKSWELKATEISEYAMSAKIYAELLALNEQKTQLEDLRANVVLVLEKYSIGSKSNPVGYSGLLGLKNLKNRVEGLITQNEAKVRAKKNELQTMAGILPAQWSVQKNRTKDFLSTTFRNEKKLVTQATTPAPVRAAMLGAESLGKMKEAERARFLPRIGLFAQGDLYNGKRDTATNYSAGAYLQWELFSASNFGAVSQAEHSAAAAEARADGLKRKMISDQDSSLSGIVAIEKNLSLLDESAALLEEQTKTARNLFRNGSINALQLVEVLSRRADLIQSRSDAEMSLAEMKAAQLMTTGEKL